MGFSFGPHFNPHNTHSHIAITQTVDLLCFTLLCFALIKGNKNSFLNGRRQCYQIKVFFVWLTLTERVDSEKV
ncbi:hypothetical protein M0804_009595 [Polistes exclamans]|nr:hypothetical protein M0804_009595 [Polistes exclamans]